MKDVSYMRSCVRKIVRDRERLYEKLYERFRPIPSKANFLLVDVTPMTADEFHRKMMEKKIIVRKFGKFRGFEGEYTRITVGTTKENDRLLGEIKKL